MLKRMVLMAAMLCWLVPAAAWAEEGAFPSDFFSIGAGFFVPGAGYQEYHDDSDAVLNALGYSTSSAGFMPGPSLELGYKTFSDSLGIGFCMGQFMTTDTTDVSSGYTSGTVTQEFTVTHVDLMLYLRSVADRTMVYMGFGLTTTTTELKITTEVGSSSSTSTDEGTGSGGVIELGVNTVEPSGLFYGAKIKYLTNAVDFGDTGDTVTYDLGGAMLEAEFGIAF